MKRIFTVLALMASACAQDAGSSANNSQTESFGRGTAWGNWKKCYLHGSFVNPERQSDAPTIQLPVGDIKYVVIGGQNPYIADTDGKTFPLKPKRNGDYVEFTAKYKGDINITIKESSMTIWAVINGRDRLVRCD